MKFKTYAGVVLKIVVPVVVGLVVLVVVVAWLSGFFTEKIEPGQREVAWRKITSADEGNTDEVHEVDKQYIEEAIGTLKAATRTEIAARIMAPINEIRVKAGDTVEAGGVLVLLDRRDMEIRLSQAKASFDAARAALTQRERDHQRDSQLYKEKVIAAAQFEQASANLKIARADLEHVQEKVAEAEVMLSYTSIMAPQAGTVVDRLAEPGDITRPGVPLLVLYDRTSLRLEVPVMENLAIKLQLGQKLIVRIDALNREVEATVDEVVPQAEAASRSFLIKVKLPRSEGLFEGMVGRLLIPAGVRTHLCLNTAAIQTIGQLQFVEVVKPDGTLERRFIKTGRLGMPERVEVISGLKAKERVLLRRSADAAGPAGSGQEGEPNDQ